MSMTAFEYKLENFGPEMPMSEIPAALNQLGKDGWELVTVVIGPSSGPFGYAGYWFKRPLPK